MSRHRRQRRNQTREPVIGITHSVKVHAVIHCDECDFVANGYIDAIDQAEAHHRETGHELMGEVGLAVWIGNEGRKRNQKRVDAILGPAIGEEQEAQDEPNI